EIFQRNRNRQSSSEQENNLKEDSQRVQVQRTSIGRELHTAQPEKKVSGSGYAQQGDISKFPFLFDQQIENHHEHAEHAQFQFRNDGADILKADALNELRHYRFAPFSLALRVSWLRPVEPAPCVPAFNRGAPCK